MGFLLAIEGADGAGKATASALVAEQLVAAGRAGRPQKARDVETKGFA